MVESAAIDALAGIAGVKVQYPNVNVGGLVLLAAEAVGDLRDERFEEAVTVACGRFDCETGARS